MANTSIASILLNVLDFVYTPMNLIALAFIYCESLLRTLSIGVILIMTSGKILSLSKKMICKCLKIFIYIYYLVYTVYSLGIFTNLLTLNILEWSTFVLSVLSPICMVVLGKIISNAKIKGYKIFTYIVIMLLYLLIGWLWFIIAPKTVNFTILFYVWLFALTVVGAVTVIGHFSGGGVP